LRFGLIDENTFVGSEDRDTPSWFQFFNKELVRMASFSDHEAFDHPVACKIFALVLFLSFFKILSYKFSSVSR